MSNIQDYPSRIGERSSLKLGTFSYLTQMNSDRLRKQIDYLVRQNWDAALEHVEPERAGSNYWYLWKLPLFGERNADVVLDEIEACKTANPGHHVRLIGYDKLRQTQGTAMVVHRGD